MCHTTKKEIQHNGEKISLGEERKRKKRKRRENEEIREEPKFFLGSPTNRRSEYIRPKTKVGLLGKDYEYVPKSRDFIEDPSRGMQHPNIYHSSLRHD